MPSSAAESAGVSGRRGGADDGPQFNIELAEGPEVETSAGLDRYGVDQYTLDGARGWTKGDLCSPTLPQLLAAHDGGREPEVS